MTMKPPQGWAFGTDVRRGGASTHAAKVERVMTAGRRARLGCAGEAFMFKELPVAESSHDD